MATATCFGFASGAWAADPSTPAAQFLEAGLLEDPSGKLGIEQVSAPGQAFRSISTRGLNLGVSKSTYWLRFAARAEADRADDVRQWLLDLGWPFQRATLYIPQATGWRSVHGGLDHSEGGGQAHLGVFRLPLTQAPKTFYLRVSSGTALFVPLRVVAEQTYFGESKRRLLWFGIYIGLMLALVFHSLFLFASLGDRSYLWYVLHVFAVTLYFLQINAVPYQFTDVAAPVYHRLTLFALTLTLIGIAQFSRVFLLTSTTTPRGDLALRGFMWLAIGSGLTIPIVPLSVLNQIFPALGLIILALVLWAGVACWRQDFRPARFLVVGWVFYALGGLVYGLMFVGVLPFEAWSQYSYQVATVIEAIMLSLALAERVKSVRIEREEMSRRSLRYERLAAVDDLTGLYNKRTFRLRLDEIRERESGTFSLILLDVDNFKHYNDRYGHLAGDQVLAALGSVIRASVRGNDVACRYGGEEFAVILPQTNGVQAQAVAERMRQDFSKLTFFPWGKAGLTVTVSLGVAEHRAGEAATALVKRADEALYEAKNAGKNKALLAS